MIDNRIYILNDIPIVSIQNDALDFTPYVESLADIINTSDTPLTIGVYGTWGSGKTSLMRMIEEKVKTNGMITGWFDAWKYDKEENLWRAFLFTTLSSLRAVTPPGRPIEYLEYLEIMLYRDIYLEKAGGVTIDLEKLGGKVTQGIVQVDLSFIPAGQVLQKMAEKLKKPDAENITQIVLDTVQHERSKIHIEQVRFIEQFQDRFRLLVKQFINKHDNRLVIFIDDLDRCLPEKVIEVLDAIKLFEDIPGCVFILGLVPEVIARSVEMYYNVLAEHIESDQHVVIDGAEYLKKLICLPFQIPPVEHTDIVNFVYRLSHDWLDDECPSVFAVGIGSNPRQIKRAVNVFHMLWLMAKKREDKLHGEIKPVRLAKVVAIQTSAPLLYDILKEQPGLLMDLERYYRFEDGLDHEYPLENQSGMGTKFLDRPVLPEDLTILVDSYPAVRRILTIKHRQTEDTSFIGLSPSELRFYFTLTRHAETPQEANIEKSNIPFEPQLVRIPAGKFIIGTSAEQAQQILDRVNNDENWQRKLMNEQPQREEDLPEYHIGKYPVTNREYQQFIREAQYKSPMGWIGEQYPDEKGDHPVVNVSCNDANEYCCWLSQKTGKEYALPSEDEWEKAARGSDGRMYPWGNEFPDDSYCNIEGWFNKTTPVGQFSPTGDSPFGCADMVGNVWEWTRSRFAYSTHNHDGVQENLQNEEKGTHVLRGGSFRSVHTLARCAFRDLGNPLNWRYNVGFRVVMLTVSEKSGD